ncbi:ATP-grasp domain-containing protein [Piscinibacter sp.]|uniref:ATP-grasp domain-containing protein n=1 Tax=Piscinibacter sp. TaxID=1903157 RepID=UPI0039E219E5
MLALAALSARAPAEAAARDGLRSVALDVFGDADTRQFAAEWHAIGSVATMRIDDELFLAALDKLARRGDVRAWSAGSGFDGRVDLLEQGAARLPLLGSAPDDVRRVRDPREFFGVLDAHGIGFPPIAFEPPGRPAGWLVKHAGGCGGWQVRRAGVDEAPAPGRYWQRERPGAAMSASFVGNGRDAVLLGVNRQGSSAIGKRPFVFTRIAGPVAVSERARRELTAIVRLLAGVFRVRGLASLDVLLDGDTLEVLELNPRLPASLALYPRAFSAHLLACERAELPAAPAGDGRVRGSEIVFAARPVHVDAALAAALAAVPGARDLPRAGTRIGAGEPACSVCAEAGGEATMNDRLAARRAAVAALLETSHE